MPSLKMECILRDRERERGGGEIEEEGKETEKEKREEEREEMRRKQKKCRNKKKQYFLNSLSLSVMMVTFI